jgi:hypothetical protein
MKKVLKKAKVINAGDMSGNLTSSAVDIEFLDNIGVQFNFTGTPTGTFDVQISMDYNTQTGAGNWISLVFSTAPAASGSANQIYIDMNQMSAPYMRVKYTATSGTGSLDAFVCGKEI